MKSHPVSLSSIHQSCCKSTGCICSTCGRSAKMKVLLPKSDVEVLDCDKCQIFMVYQTNDEKENTPDFLVYLYIPTKEPLFCFVEFKERPITHAIKQIKKGIEILKSRYEYFSVIPEPQNIDCVIARNRSKGMAHAAQLAVIIGTTFHYRGNTSKIRFVNWGERLFPNVENCYY